jgi:hypothetical protein
MAQDHDKAELIAELARTRSRMSDNVLALRRDLDFPARAKKAFKSSPWAWVGGAVLAGAIIARVWPRGPKEKVVIARKSAEPALEKAGKAGLALGVLKIVLDFARPAVTAWVRKSVTDYMDTRR